MSSRNMIDAHGLVFGALDTFCLEHNDPIKNSGSARWTAASSQEDKEWLLFADLKTNLSFADSMKISRFDLGDRAYFCTVGLDLPEEIDFLIEHDVGGNMLTAIVSELRPLPIGPTSKIRDAVEVEDKVSTPGYRGHQAAAIKSLFPVIRCFSVKDLREEETQRIFFLLCLATSGRGMQWMNAELRETLTLIAELSPVAIPYRTLCRSIFDIDPSALFMALYRCLEALYAYSHTTKLKDRLGIQESWSNVAQVLEETLSWRPREEHSLGTLLSYAVQDDLRAILDAMGHSVSGDEEVVNKATKRIYNLRNSLVHYRPFHQGFQPETINWNRLCAATALLVLHVYNAVSHA